MLKKLLKYEFKATARTFGGLYLALAAVAVLIGITLRMESSQSFAGNALDMTATIAVLVYFGLFVAIAVMTLLSIVQRFSRSLLGGEGYLMNTLPVSTKSLVGSKAIAGTVWCVAGVAVGLLTILLMTAIVGAGEIPLGTIGTGLQRLWYELDTELGVNPVLLALGMLVVCLVTTLCSIMCVYTAIMIGHQVPRCKVPVGIVAYFILQSVQSFILSALGISGARILHATGTTAQDALGKLVNSFPVAGAFWLYLAATSIPAVLFGVVYFFAADWLLHHRLNLE